MKQLTTLVSLACVMTMVLGSQRPAHGQLAPEVGAGIPPEDFNRVGQAGFQFLKLPTSARQAGMGGVNSALGYGDATSAFANPALAVAVDNLDIGLSHTQWIADINYTGAAVLKQLGSMGTFGVNVLLLDYGDMPRTENQPVLLNGEPTGRSEVLTNLGTVTARDLSVGMSYARKVTDQLYFGVIAKYISETLDDASVGAWALDIGTVYHTGIRSLRVSMVGKNVGPDTQISEFDERIGYEPADLRMPVSFSFGAAFDLIEAQGTSPHLWTVAGEFVHPNDGPEKVNVGTEYAFRNLLKLRAGYRFNYDEEGLTLGMGVNAAVSGYTLALGYAYWDFGRLGTTHILSMGFGL